MGPVDCIIDAGWEGENPSCRKGFGTCMTPESPSKLKAHNAWLSEFQEIPKAADGVL